MQQSLFNERHTITLRLWHWLTFLIVAILIFTVLVSDTFLDGQHTKAVVTYAAQRKGAALTNDQAREIVISLRATIWKWHNYFGYVLVGLYILRLLIEFFQPKDQRFVFKFKKGMKAASDSSDKKSGRHYLLVKILYAFFYLLLTGIAVTGLWLAFYKDDPAVSNETFDEIKELHENGYNMLLVFLFLHLAGVIRAEFGKDKNIISRMINGGNKNEQASA